MNISSQLLQCEIVWKFPTEAVGISKESGLMEKLDYLQVIADVLGNLRDHVFKF